jgi:hypothetical protein
MPWLVGCVSGFLFVGFFAVIGIYWLLDFDRRQLWRELETLRCSLQEGRMQ